MRCSYGRWCGSPDRVLWKDGGQGLIDGIFVHGGVLAGPGAGRMGSRLQNGQLGFYAVLFLVGAVWVLRTGPELTP